MRMVRLAGVVMVLLLTTPQAARSAVLSVADEGGMSVARYAALPSEDNDVSIEVRRSGIQVVDRNNMLDVGAGCTARSDHEAVCQADRMSAWLGDRNDRVSTMCKPSVCVPFELHGGAGNDDLAGDLMRDVIYGGPGLDNINAIDGGDRIFAGAGPDYVRGGTAGQRAVVSCGPGVDYVFPHPTMTLRRDCDGFGETGFGYSRFRARGNRLHMRIRTLGCPIGLRIGRHGPIAVARRRPKSFPITLELPGNGKRRAQLYGRRLCDNATTYQPLFGIAAR